MGFAWLLVLFLACGLAFGPLTGSAAGLRGFQTLYFISSFWAQFGPNATTFLVVRALPQRRERIHFDKFLQSHFNSICEKCRHSVCTHAVLIQTPRPDHVQGFCHSACTHAYPLCA